MSEGGVACCIVMPCNGNVMRGWVKGIVLFCTAKKAKAGRRSVLRRTGMEKQGNGTHSKGGAWEGTAKVRHCDA